MNLAQLLRQAASVKPINYARVGWGTFSWIGIPSYERAVYNEGALKAAFSMVHIGPKASIRLTINT